MGSFVFLIISTLFVLTSLIFSPKSSELFEFPKILLIYFGAGLLLPLVIFKIRKIWATRNKTKPNPQFLILFTVFAITLFLGSQVLSTLFSMDKHVSFFGYYSRFNGGLLSLISYLIIFLSVLLFFNYNRVRKLLKLFLFTGLLVALWGLPSHFGYDFICLLVLGKLNSSCWTADFVPQLRMFSTLGQPNWLATYLLVLIFLVLYYITTGYSLLPKKFKQLNKYFAWLLFILFSIELVWTNSRSGILSYIILVPSYLILLYSFGKGQFKKNLKTTWLLPIVVFVAVLLTQAFPYLAKFQSKITKPKVTISKALPGTEVPTGTLNITASSDIRLLVWQGALKLSQKYPLFGSGVETFAYSYYQTRPIEHNLTSEWNFVYNKAHNELLNYLATTGYVGLISYLLMFTSFLLPAFFVLFRSEFKNKLKSRYFALFYLASMLGIFSMNFFGFSTTVSSLLFYILPALFLVNLLDSQEDDVQKDTPDTMVQTLSFNQLVVYFVWILWLFVYLLNYFTADYNYARAREYKQIQDFDNAYFYGQKAIDIRPEPIYLDQQAVLATNLATLQQIQHNNPQVKQLTNQAKKYSSQTLQVSPSNVFYYKTKAKIYYLLSLNNIDKPEISANYFNQAIQALEKASILAPTDPITPYTHASLIYDKDLNKALNLIQRSLELKPDYLEAKELLKHLQN